MLQSPVLFFAILLLPLVGALVHFFVLKKPKGYSAFLFVFIPFLLSCPSWFFDQKVVIYGFSWLKLEGLDFKVQFLFDSLSNWMVHLILGIGSVIHLYSVGYMAKEEGKRRFFAFLNLFVFFMLVLVLADSLWLTFFGWEGVGLCSYFLIGHYANKEKARLAANKAFIMNRIGDFGFLMGLFLFFAHTQTLEYSLINQTLPDLILSQKAPLWALNLGGIFLFWACTGKSAQIPLFTWLPDAMEGPTPVSALIHAATMVTAGIYLLLRLSPVFSVLPWVREVILYTASFTAVLAALIATKQWDIKKILAYSTVSQLGFMFSGLALEANAGSLFHLSTHAFFKALLFLTAGAVINTLHHEQDIRKMSLFASFDQGLKSKMRVLFLMFAAGAWCLAGLPFGSGFFSKEQILNPVFLSNHPFVFFLLLVGSFLTAYYIYRLFYLVFFQKNSSPSKEPDIGHSSLPALPKTMRFSLFILAIGSFVVSLSNLPHWLEFITEPIINLRLQKIGISPSVLEGSFAKEMLVTSFALGCAVFGFWVARFSFWAQKKEKTGSSSSDHNGLRERKFFIDEIYDEFLVKPFLSIGQALKNFAEPFFYHFPLAIKQSFVFLGQRLGQSGGIFLQPKSIQTYGIIFTFGLFGLVLLFQFFVHF